MNVGSRDRARWLARVGDAMERIVSSTVVMRVIPLCVLIVALAATVAHAECPNTTPAEAFADGETLLGAEMFDEAAECFIIAAAAPALAAHANLLLARAEVGRGHPGRALALLDAVIASRDAALIPEAIDTLFHIARSADAAGQWDVSVGAYTALVAAAEFGVREEEVFAAYLRLATAQERAGRLLDAIASLNLALSLPASTEAKRGVHHEIRRLAGAVALEPTNPMPERCRAANLVLAEDPSDEMAAEVRRAIGQRCKLSDSPRPVAHPPAPKQPPRSTPPSTVSREREQPKKRYTASPPVYQGDPIRFEFAGYLLGVGIGYGSDEDNGTHGLVTGELGVRFGALRLAGLINFYASRWESAPSSDGSDSTLSPTATRIGAYAAVGLQPLIHGKSAVRWFIEGYFGYVYGPPFDGGDARTGLAGGGRLHFNVGIWGVGAEVGKSEVQGTLFTVWLAVSALP